MKRWLVAFLALLGVLIPVSARADTSSSSTDRSTQRSLIVYFSASGNTKIAAQQIQKATGADIYRLQPAKPYSSDYDQLVKRGNRERKNNIHPAIKGTIPNWDQYDTIYVGFPTWWQQPPMIIHTLFDDYDFSGKTIVPFTTSSSTPMSASMPYIRKMAAKDHAKVINGFRYDDNPGALRKYLKRHHLINAN